MSYKKNLLSVYPLINNISTDLKTNIYSKMFEKIDNYIDNKDFIKYIIDKKIKKIKKILQVVFMRVFLINKNKQNKENYIESIKKIYKLIKNNEDYFLIILLQKIIFNFTFDVYNSSLTSENNLFIYLLERCVPFSEKSNLKILNNLTVPFTISYNNKKLLLKDNNSKFIYFFNNEIFENISINIQYLIYKKFSNKISALIHDPTSNYYYYNNTKNFHKNLNRLFKDFSNSK